MNPAMTVSSPLQHGRDGAATAPLPEDCAPLGRSLLYIPVLAIAAWTAPIGAAWLAWHALQ